MNHRHFLSASAFAAGVIMVAALIVTVDRPWGIWVAVLAPDPPADFRIVRVDGAFEQIVVDAAELEMLQWVLRHQSPNKLDRVAWQAPVPVAHNPFTGGHAQIVRVALRNRAPHAGDEPLLLYVKDGHVLGGEPERHGPPAPTVES